MIIYYLSLLIALVTLVSATLKVRAGKSLQSIWLPLEIQGSFVWADGIVFGVFWTIASLLFLILNFELNWFYLLFLIFWAVRAAGEIIYWFLNQFNPRKNQSSTFQSLNRFFKNEYVTSFIFQIWWQCVLVLCIFGIIVTLY